MFVSRKKSPSLNEEKEIVIRIPRRRISSPLVGVCSPQINILSSFEGKSFPDCISLIKAAPNMLSSFPRVQSYLAKLYYVKFATLCQFSFYTLCSQLLFFEHWLTPNYKQYAFIWVLDDKSFEIRSDYFNCMKLEISEETTGDEIILSCDLAQISTVGFPLTELVINRLSYTQSRVPILLGLYLALAMGINEVRLMDAAYKEVECNGEPRKAKLLDERMMMCGKSMYARFGFVPESGETATQVCKIPLKKIIDEYKAKILYPAEYKSAVLGKELSVNQEKDFDRVMEAVTPVFNSLLAVEDYDITLGEWLSTLPSGQRNCSTIALEKLTSDYLNYTFQYRGITYGKGHFATLYEREYEAVLVNTDISKTLRHIFKHGLSN